MVYQMIYVGRRKIYAIKAVRAYCSLGLKEAKNACEGTQGFLVSPLKAAAILGEYMRGYRHDLDGSVPERTASDWKIGDYVQVNQPVDLTDDEFNNYESLLSGTRGLT